jgi:Gas vesicle synthesis protein GvpL/GvpF
MGGDEQLYVYALAVPGLPAKLTLIRRRIHVIHESGVDAVVEPAAAVPEPTIETLQTQFAVVAALDSRVPALLPARFGALIAESALRSLLASRHQVFDEALQHVRHCVQMTIRIFGEPDAGGPPPTPTVSGTAYLERQRARAHRTPPEVAAIRRHLRSYVRDERVDAGDHALRVTVWHLVARASLDEYRRRTRDLPSMLTPHRVVVTGPLPVFAFAPDVL